MAAAGDLGCWGPWFWKTLAFGDLGCFCGPWLLATLVVGVFSVSYIKEEKRCAKKDVLKKIRKAEKSLGNYIKKPHKDELINLEFIRKKIVAKKEIFIGDKFTSKNLTTKRSKNGLPASSWKKILGKRAKKRFRLNEGVIN